MALPDDLAYTSAVDLARLIRVREISPTELVASRGSSWSTLVRSRHPAAFKAKVGVEAVKQTRTLAELSRAFQVHPVQISQWKKQLLDGIDSLFHDGRRHDHDESQAIQAELYEQIGRLKMELEWLKEKLPASSDLKRPLVEPDNPQLGIRRQCELLGLNRSSYYLVPASESEEDLRLIDQQFLRTPFYGSRRMTVYVDATATLSDEDGCGKSFSGGCNSPM